MRNPITEYLDGVRFNSTWAVTILFLLLVSICFSSAIISQGSEILSHKDRINNNSKDITALQNNLGLVNLNQRAISDNLARENQKVSMLESKLIHLDSQINYTLSENSALREKIVQQDQGIEELLINFASRPKGSGLLNPTYQQLKKFVDSNMIDQEEWTEKHDCTEFTNDFITAFSEIGFISYAVEVNYVNELGNDPSVSYGHILITTNTTDRGIVYVEPQNDAIFESLLISDNYCEKAGWNCRWIVEKVSSPFVVLNKE